MPILAKFVHNLPTEIFDEIKGYTFAVEGDEVIEITKGTTASQDIPLRRSTDVACRLQAPSPIPDRPRQPHRLR